MRQEVQLYTVNKPIPRNRIIGEYTGVQSRKPINGNYVLEVHKNRFINANGSTDIGCYCNDCRSCNRRNGEYSGNSAKLSFFYEEMTK